MAGKMLGLAGALILLTAYAIDPSGSAVRQAGPSPGLVTSDQCMSCHNGLRTAAWEDVSIGSSWQTGMMANAARDPYWQASVRREVMDHAFAAEAIEHECSRCHMPMANVESAAVGQSGAVFANLAAAGPMAALAADGVSCALCHTVTPEGLGSEESFVGGFVTGTDRAAYGPFEVDAGRQRVMESVTGLRPREGSHLAQSEFCATCHTLITHAFGPDGQVVGELPEQVPFLEWKHSAYVDAAGCPSCHMPVVNEDIAISSVLGQPRPYLSRHTFLGGNAFMQRLLGRNRDETGTVPGTAAMEAAAGRTEGHLGGEAAELTVRSATEAEGTLTIDIAVANLAGHKLPTAYPSRRAWISLEVKDAAGRMVFSSGMLRPDGAIAGNDNDEDAGRFEPHHRTITSPEQVQVYESILGTPDGAVTTGLLKASRYLKDNRLLPDGFDKDSAEARIAVRGDAATDDDFNDAGDRVRYLVDVRDARAPYTVEATLWYQSIGYRWAHNLAETDAPEPQRFVRMYEASADVSASRLATARLRVE